MTLLQPIWASCWSGSFQGQVSFLWTWVLFETVMVKLLSSPIRVILWVSSSAESCHYWTATCCGIGTFPPVHEYGRLKIIGNPPVPIGDTLQKDLYIDIWKHNNNNIWMSRMTCDNFTYLNFPNIRSKFLIKLNHVLEMRSFFLLLPVVDSCQCQQKRPSKRSPCWGLYRICTKSAQLKVKSPKLMHWLDSITPLLWGWAKIALSFNSMSGIGHLVFRKLGINQTTLIKLLPCLTPSGH